MKPINIIITEEFNKILLSEGYDHMSQSSVEQLKTLDQYHDYDNKKIIDNYTLLNWDETNGEYNRLYDSWYLWGKVIAFDNTDNTEIGNVTYSKRYKNSPLLGSIDVRPDKRRLGVGSRMYEFIEEITGEKISPDKPHTKSAEMFWANPNRKFGFDK